MNLSVKGISNAIALGMAVCFIATGCGSSNTDISELEKRVDELEKQVAELKANTTNTPVTTSQDYSTETKEDNTPEESTAEISEETPQVQYAYKIDDMSNDEVVEECMYILNNKPVQGSTLSDYFSSLHAVPFGDPVFPQYAGSGSHFTVIFTSDENGDEIFSADCDAIKSIRIEGIQSAMDGTIEYISHSPITVTVSVDIVDYDRAVSIYEALYEKLAPYYTDVNDYKDGTSWSVQGSIRTSDYSSYGLNIVSMHKMDTCYTVSASLATQNN